MGTQELKHNVVGNEQGLSSEKPKKKKGLIRRFFGWIFKLILFAIIVTAILIGLALRLPEKLGIAKSRTEKVFEYTPDRQLAQEMLEAAQASGLSTEGVSLYVFPKKDSDQSAAYAILDQSQGFRLNATSEGDPFLDTMVALVRSQAAGKAKVEHVSVEYKDASGKSLLTLGAPTKAVLDFADKKISQEQFSESLGAKVDLRNVVEASLMTF